MTQRDSARTTLLAALTLDGSTCEHCHLHFKWSDGSGKHATVEVATAADGTWTAYINLWRSTPTVEEPSKYETVKQVTKHGHATAAEAIAAIFDGPAPLWPAPRETT